ARVPFSSARKWSAIVTPAAAAETESAADREPPTVWYMGAPEVMLSALSGEHGDVLEAVNDYANSGNRVLLIARATLIRKSDGDAATDSSWFTQSPELLPDAKPVALVLCSERVRDDAQPTLAWFRDQGVRCRIISGDNPVTVGAIAAKVRLTGDREPHAIDARTLPQDINELARVLENVDVIGRVLPDQKKAIVQALHTSDHVVAMTGDGVNDSLAIKEADLGIAMGNAAPATKAVAQVVLVDSKFSHLPDVVARGRQVMANMERVASLFLVKTVYSALISLGVVLTAIPFPYLPRHITYVGALTIGMPAFILALAPNTRRYIPGFLRRVVHFALPGGVAIALSVLLSSWLLPDVMGWDVNDAADLSALRTTCAIIVFVLGVFMLARVAQPLNSWRGVLVAVFAAAGVIGMLIPFVARFFDLHLPTGRVLIATVAALLISTALFAVCHVILASVTRIFPHIKPTRQS
ncbi:HAD-IC family P-type ATPase, partial [Bifidobacterium bifidum]